MLSVGECNIELFQQFSLSCVPERISASCYNMMGLLRHNITHTVNCGAEQKVPGNQILRYRANDTSKDNKQLFISLWWKKQKGTTHTEKNTGNEKGYY